MTEHLDKLIVVAGHAAFKKAVDEVPKNVVDDSHWVLQPFQYGEPSYYIEHIHRGAELAAKEPSSLLLFSGGRTHREAGQWSEAATYKAIAEYYDYWDQDEVVNRIGLEEYARDSFENISFSLYEFYRRVGRYPTYVTVVGWTFKTERFKFHALTLGIPDEKFTYVGVNNPPELHGAITGEKRALEQFRQDPTGIHSPLSDKRRERNPFHRQPPYDTCPEIRLSTDNLSR